MNHVGYLTLKISWDSFLSPVACRFACHCSLPLSLIHQVQLLTHWLPVSGLNWRDKDSACYGRLESCTCCLMSLYILAGNLSGQSAASVLHPQQTLHPPGNIPETGQNQLLQPLKPSPSSDNLYSAFTSDGAISVPSLSAPGQGKKSKHPSPSRNINMEVAIATSGTKA